MSEPTDHTDDAQTDAPGNAVPAKKSPAPRAPRRPAASRSTTSRAPSTTPRTPRPAKSAAQKSVDQADASPAAPAKRPAPKRTTARPSAARKPAAQAPLASEAETSVEPLEPVEPVEDAPPAPVAETSVGEVEEALIESSEDALIEDAEDALVEATAEAPSADAQPALVLRGVSKTFGDLQALDGITLTVPAGSFYGLVGPNGAGKTTTLSIIAGLLRADGGEITVAGVDARRHPLAAKRLMGVLPDRFRTFDRLTGRQLLHYYGALRGLPSAEVDSRATDLARAFDLTDALGRVVSDYSAGMAKKIMLAGALIHSPRVLVLDEPFEAVDPVSSAAILDILSAYVAHGGTVILSSHGMDLVERVCLRVAVIVAGALVAEGTVEDVRGTVSLEERFVELAGGAGEREGLEWLHTFSD